MISPSRKFRASTKPGCGDLDILKRNSDENNHFIENLPVLGVSDLFGDHFHKKIRLSVGFSICFGAMTELRPRRNRFYICFRTHRSALMKSMYDFSIAEVPCEHKTRPW